MIIRLKRNVFTITFFDIRKVKGWEKLDIKFRIRWPNKLEHWWDITIKNKMLNIGW